MLFYILVFIACICSLTAISTIALKTRKGNAVIVVLSVIGLVAGYVALAINAPRDTDQLGFDYLGIIVAILAIFATLLLGLQLYNALNLKEDAEKVAEAKEIVDRYANQVKELEEKLKMLEDKAVTIDDLLASADDSDVIPVLKE